MPKPEALLSLIIPWDPVHGVWFGNLRVASFVFTDVILLAFSSQDLQHAMEQFAAECEAAGMRISSCYLS